MQWYLTILSKSDWARESKRMSRLGVVHFAWFDDAGRAYTFSDSPINADASSALDAETVSLMCTVYQLARYTCYHSDNCLAALNASVTDSQSQLDRMQAELTTIKEHH
jgi:hypothetical protein